MSVINSYFVTVDYGSTSGAHALDMDSYWRE